MNVKELREALVGLPDDMLVCGVGWYDEPLDVDGFLVRKVHPYMVGKPFKAFTIDMENAGEGPE